MHDWTSSHIWNPPRSRWIVDSYELLIAGSVIRMGTQGDRIGPPRLLLGAAAFGLASVLTVLSSPSLKYLDGVPLIPSDSAHGARFGTALR